MFYVVEISKKASEETESKSIYSYATSTEAVAIFHQKLGGAMKNEDFITEMVMVIDKQGAVITYEYFSREVEPDDSQYEVTQ